MKEFFIENGAQFSVGSVEGVPFTACTSGPDIIILASNFSRVQQITLKSHISSLDCSNDVGKIAAAYDTNISVYEPQQTGLTVENKWIQTATIEAASKISVMSFNLEGTRIIAGGQTLQLWVTDNGTKNNWQCVWRFKTASTITYLKFSPDGSLFCSASKLDRLVKIWYESVTKFNFSFIYIAHPMPITGLEWRRTSKYTPRGAVANVLITSCKDNLARVWVQTLLPDDGLVNFHQLKTKNEELVNGVQPVQAQRHRQKFLRRLKRLKAFSSNVNENQTTNVNTAMPTALSAHDFHTYALCSNVVKPGLHFHLAGIIEANIEENIKSSTISDSRFKEESSNNQFVVHWINNKEIHITRSIELLLHDMLIRILRGNNQASSSNNSPQSAGESCSGSENDTDDLDIPNDDTITAESSKKLRHKLCRKVNKQRALAASGRRDSDDNSSQSNQRPSNQNNGRTSPTSLVEEFDKALESLLKRWQTSADLLFSINKSDGTLTLWQVKYLDGEDAGVFRQVQIDRLSCLKAALSHYDATTMSLNIIAYSPSAYLDVKRAYLAVTNSSLLANDGSNIFSGEQFTPADVPDILSINTSPTNAGRSVEGGSALELKDSLSASSVSEAEPSIFIVTQHLSGILGLWKLNFDSTYPKVQSIDLVTRITGLPIDPSWLKDGILNVEYDEDKSGIITKWVPDEHSLKLTSKTGRPYSPWQSKTFPFNFEETKCSHLPSVDEETTKSQANQNLSINAASFAIDSFRASQMASIIDLLPQYHLKQLIELLAFGKLQKVKAILNHLVNCLLALDPHQDKDDKLVNHAPWAHRSRTLSIVGTSSSSFHDSFDIDNPSSSIQQQVVEEIELDYIEVTAIKPLPLYQLLEADNQKSNASDSDHSTTRQDFSVQDYESFMPTRSQVDETLDEILGQSALETLNRQKSLKKKNKSSGEGSLTSFNPRKAKLLTNVLTHTHLPGLTNVDQMHLLAVADAVAMFDASPNDYNEMNDEENYDSSSRSLISTNIAIDSLDDRGLRFLTAMRQYVYLTRCLPMKQRSELQACGVGNHNVVWAFHSESQDELVSLIPCVNRNKPEWSELREYGVGWWLKKPEVLRKLIEKVAQSAFQVKQDPLDAALFYLAMKKKTLVCALLRRVNCDKRLLKLFEQDFNDPVNRKKALKNAYALLGLHRFEHAAAFFILAGSIWDAVEVCINNLNDIQLAIILIRLHDTDMSVPNNLKRLLFTEILGSKMPKEYSISSTADNQRTNNSIDHKSNQNQYQYNPKRAHQDPFLRSMAFWKLGDYLSAVHTLLENDVGQSRPTLTHNNSIRNSDSRRNSETQNTLSESSTGQLSPTHNYRGNLSVSASVFNFYLFLKDQPLVVKHKHQLLEEIEIRKRTSPTEEEQIHCHRARSLSSGELNFDDTTITRAIKQSSTEYEVLNETTRFVDKYSDEAIADKERVLFFSTAYSYLEAGCPMLALEVLCSEDHLNMSKAQRMKFIACLHILMNELKTLASSNQGQSTIDANVDEKFRGTFHQWLKRNVDAMRKVCSYLGDINMNMNMNLNNENSNFHDDVDVDVDDDKNKNKLDRSKESASTLMNSISHEDDKLNNEEHIELCDISWVKINEPILRAMLTYCNLHSANENSLTTVRLELLALLKNL